MHNIIVVQVCSINFFYAFFYIVPGPILRHLGEFGKNPVAPWENTRFLAEGGVSMGLWLFILFNLFVSLRIFLSYDIILAKMSIIVY